MESFKKLGINESILKSLRELGFTEPSEIQEKAIPLVLEGKDLLGGSATGSGKTLAFGAGILQNIKKRAGVQALVLTPTRELAEQVAKALRVFSKYDPVNIVTIYGGVAIGPQIHGLRNAEVVVGTPGRILDHLERKTLNLSNISLLVLDEADIMFDMGFIVDVEKIIRQCPENRQTLLFSATLSQDILRLTKKYMKHPINVSAVENVDPSKLTQVYYNVPDNMKFSLLVHLLREEQGGLVMVFCNTQKTTDFVAHNLKGNNIEAEAIHGGLSQAKRNSILKHFHTAKVFVLVCTDVAARGLDIKGVSHVYNFDIPKDSKQYVHRIGRTARAGHEGKAINILSDRDHENFSRVLRDNRMKILKQEVPHVERVNISLPNRGGDDRRDSRGGPRRGGFRPHGGGGYRGGGERRDRRDGDRRDGDRRDGDRRERRDDGEGRGRLGRHFRGGAPKRFENRRKGYHEE